MNFFKCTMFNQWLNNHFSSFWLLNWKIWPNSPSKNYEIIKRPRQSVNYKFIDFFERYYKKVTQTF